MTVQQQGATKAIDEKRELSLDRCMIGTVRLGQPLIELLQANCPAPKIPMLLRASWDNSEAAASPRGYAAAASAVDDRRIDLILGAVAVDCSAGRALDHGAAAALQCSPYQAIDEGILEDRQGRLPGRCKGEQPIGIVASRMRHGKQNRQVPARLMDNGGGELAHDQG
jgi:hypothetical protein